MKIPMKWLKDYVDINISAEEYAKRMIMSGTAVEGIEYLSDFDGVVAAKVLACDKHPDSDHLHVCAVDIGSDAPLQIVCGAPNVRAGAYVLCALEGANLPGGMKIKRGKIRGVESCGMLCSGPELGVPDYLYPHCGDEGILILNEAYPLGMDAREVLGLSGEVVEYEILANRPDCLSVWGIARESATVLNEHCVMPEITVEETGEGVFSDYANVRVEDDTLCPRYCARVISNVKIGPSPKWMREYLNGAGVRSINNIVDITNFVMLETGHPMHAFDLAHVRGNTIVVRRARDGEQLTTLDGKQHVLTNDMLVIADEQNATGLAGIMGGEHSEIMNDTQNVLFECAAFERGNNRVTARALGIRTESSGRFEKGVCADTVMEALERACMLVNMLNCGNVVPGVYDHYPNPAQPRSVMADVKRIQALIGVDIPGERMEDILTSLNMDVTLSNDGILTCAVPAWRQDIESEADIAEEVLRLYGYDHIPSTLMSGVTMAGMRNDAQSFKTNVKRAFIAQGFYEAQNYSFISPKWLSKLGLPEGDWRLSPVVIKNPLGEDTSVMRTSLAPSMLSTLALNMNRGNAEAKLVEVASVFKPTDDNGGLPRELPALCVGMYGEHADFYALKRAVMSACELFGLTPDAQAGGDCYYHPGRKAALTLRGGSVKLGQMGEAHPDVREAFELAQRAYIAEIDLSALCDCRQPIPAIKPLPKYPQVARDIALVVNESVNAGPLMGAIEKAAGKLCEQVKLFDLYRGDKLGENKKSLAFSITFRAPDRTLTENEIMAAMDKILLAVKQRFGAEIRS